MTDFISAIRNAGFNPPSYIAPGKWIRFPSPGKAKGDAGYAYFFPGEFGGIFGDWSTGDKFKWQKEGLTSEQTHDYTLNLKAIQEESVKRQNEEWAQAAIKAHEYCLNLLPADKHPYLEKKKISSCGALIDGDKLIIPLYAPDGSITTYQSISEDGSKKLMYGGKKKGSAFIIQGNTLHTFITEGFSTGASVHEATGATVLVAIDAGNLAHVANAALANGNHRRIVIAADNDAGKERNVGIESAKAICKIHPSITYIVPPSKDSPIDWNDYVILHGKEKARSLLLNEPQVYIKEDLIEHDESSALFPWRDGELIELGMIAAQEVSGIDIEPYNFPTIITHIARAIAGKIRFRNVHPSIFAIRVGATASGKTSSDRELGKIIAPMFIYTNGKKETTNTFYGATDFASGPGLLRAVQRQPRCLIQIDEITYVFKSSNKNDSLMQGKIAAILELATAAGQRLERVFSDAGNNVIIEDSCISLTGNATPKIFESFTHEDLYSGLLQRFDFFSYSGLTPYRTETLPQSDNALDFANKIFNIVKIEKPQGSYNIVTDGAVDIGITDDARAVLNAYSRETTDETRKQSDDGLRGIVSRRYDTAIKYALIHAGSTRQGQDLFLPLDNKNIEWGIDVSNKLCDWKLNILVGKIAAGEFDSLVLAFVAGAKAAINSRRKPTGAVIGNCRPKIKDLVRRQFDDVVNAARARGLIRIREDGGRTIYEPLKE